MNKTWSVKFLCEANRKSLHLDFMKKIINTKICDSMNGGELSKRIYLKSSTLSMFKWMRSRAMLLIKWIFILVDYGSMNWMQFAIRTTHKQQLLAGTHFNIIIFIKDIENKFYAEIFFHSNAGSIFIFNYGIWQNIIWIEKDNLYKNCYVCINNFVLI